MSRQAGKQTFCGTTPLIQIRQGVQMFFVLCAGEQIDRAAGRFTVTIAASGGLCDAGQAGHAANDAVKAQIYTCFNELSADTDQLLCRVWWIQMGFDGVDHIHAVLRAKMCSKAEKLDIRTQKRF